MLAVPTSMKIYNYRPAFHRWPPRRCISPHFPSMPSFLQLEFLNLPYLERFLGSNREWLYTPHFDGVPRERVGWSDVLNVLVVEDNIFGV